MALPFKLTILKIIQGEYSGSPWLEQHDLTFMKLLPNLSK